MNKTILITFVLALLCVGLVSGTTPSSVSGKPSIYDNWNTAVYEDKLLAFYRFDNESSVGENDTVVYDWTGLENNGTIIGAVYNLTNKTLGDSAIQFDGVNDYINISNSSGGALNFSENGTYSISAWAKTNVADSKHHPIITKGDHQYALKIDASGNVWEFVEFQEGVGWKTVTSSVTVGVWTHLVGVRNGTNMYLYKDGVLVDNTITLISSGASRETEHGVEIGRNSESTSSVFNGTIDEVMIFNRSLSASEVKDIYNQTDKNKVIPYEDMSIISDVTFLEGTYYLNDSEGDDGAIIFNCDDCTLDCNHATLIGNFTAGSKAIRSDNRLNINIKNCNFYNYQEGITINGNNHTNISNMFISNMSNDGILIQKGHHYILDNITIYNTSNVGIFLSGSDVNKLSEVIVKNSFMSNNAEDGITIHEDGSGNSVGENFTIINCTSELNGENSYDITSGTNVLLENNVGRNSTDGSILIGLSAKDVNISSHNSTDESDGTGAAIIVKAPNVQVSYSIFQGNSYHFVSIGENASNVTFHHNTFLWEGGSSTPFDFDGYNLTNITVRDNIFTEITERADRDVYMRFLNPSQQPDNNNFTINYNLYYTNSSVPFQNTTTKISFSNFQSVYGQEANGVEADPLFTDAPNGDYSSDSGITCSMSSTKSHVGAIPCTCISILNNSNINFTEDYCTTPTIHFNYTITSDSIFIENLDAVNYNLSFKDLGTINQIFNQTSTSPTAENVNTFTETIPPNNRTLVFSYSTNTQPTFSEVGLGITDLTPSYNSTQRNFTFNCTGTGHIVVKDLDKIDGASGYVEVRHNDTFITYEKSDTYNVTSCSKWDFIGSDYHFCGDGTCNSDEDTTSCSSDCGDPAGATSGGGGARGGSGCDIFADDYNMCFYIGLNGLCKEGCQTGYVCNSTFRCVLEETIEEEPTIAETFVENVDKAIDKITDIISDIFNVPENTETFINATSCERMDTFQDRLRDKCRINNGICEDAETPLDADCRLDSQSISCKNRCIFKEIWFAKILIIALILMIAFHKKDYNVFIGLIILLLLLNFIDAPLVEDLKGDLENIAPNVTPELNISEEQFNNNYVLKYGGKVMPSNPTLGFFIIIGLIYLAFKYIFNRVPLPRKK